MEDVLSFVANYWLAILIAAGSVFWGVPTLLVGGKMHIQKRAKYKLGAKNGGFVVRFFDYGFGWFLALLWPLTLMLAHREQNRQ